MSRSTTAKLPYSPDEMLEKARKTAKKAGILFEGDEKTGIFEGKGFGGHYRIVDDQVTLTVTKKPIVMPWKVVESALEKIFSLKSA